MKIVRFKYFLKVISMITVKMRMNKRPLPLLISIILLLSVVFVSASNETQGTQSDSPTTNYVCAVYFTGVGCPHCAKTDPVILKELLNKYPNLVIIEYEIYQHRQNAPLLYSYNEAYGSGLGIPLIIFSKDKKQHGDLPILKDITKILDSLDSNPCPLLSGSSISFNDLDIDSLPGNPNIWFRDRILIKEGNGDSSLLKRVLQSDNVSLSLQDIEFKVIDSKPVALSGKMVDFDNAIKLGGWVFQWNGKSITSQGCQDKCPKPGEWGACVNGTQTRINYKCSKETGYVCVEYNETRTCDVGRTQKLTLTKILGLAAVDAVNPCALAVLTLMLIAILTYNPKKRMNVLLAGLAFTLSVFVMYIIYGFIIINFFQFVQLLTGVRLWLYKMLGLAAVILGVLNIRDFVRYKPGRLGTEMPLMLRPKVKKIISKATSPRGAFIVGLFVTVFLLPCTIGPYVIAGGILSALELLKTLPWLLIYNFVFVLPMIIITLIVYLGFTTVENVSGWKDKNIRYLHLVAGIIMFFLGVAMIGGWI